MKSKAFRKHYLRIIHQKPLKLKIFMLCYIAFFNKNRNKNLINLLATTDLLKNVMKNFGMQLKNTYQRSTLQEAKG